MIGRQYYSVSGAYQTHTEPLSALVLHQLCQRAEKKKNLKARFFLLLSLSVFMPSRPVDSWSDLFLRWMAGSKWGPLKGLSVRTRHPDPGQYRQHRSKTLLLPLYDTNTLHHCMDLCMSSKAMTAWVMVNFQYISTFQTRCGFSAIAGICYEW